MPPERKRSLEHTEVFKSMTELEEFAKRNRNNPGIGDIELTFSMNPNNPEDVKNTLEKMNGGTVSAGQLAVYAAMFLVVAGAIVWVNRSGDDSETEEHNERPSSVRPLPRHLQSNERPTRLPPVHPTPTLNGNQYSNNGWTSAAPQNSLQPLEENSNPRLVPVPPPSSPQRSTYPQPIPQKRLYRPQHR